MAPPSWTDLLTAAFPNLAGEGFDIVDEPSPRYNCIAYAASDTSKGWWPDGLNYWPPWATPTNSIESLQEAFTGLGYQESDQGDDEDGFQRVALYEVQGKMRHATVQAPNGRWRSKMGRGPVIEHRDPASLSRGPYGNPTVFMRRATVATDHH